MRLLKGPTKSRQRKARRMRRSSLSMFGDCVMDVPVNGYDCTRKKVSLYRKKGMGALIYGCKP